MVAASCGGNEKRRATAPCTGGAPQAAALRGDVDGDGQIDSVRISRGKQKQRCLVVSGRRTLTKALPYRQGGPEPRLNGLGAIDREPGLEMVVTLDQGASTAFASVFSIRDGDVVLLRRPDSAGHEFAYEGGVTHFDGVDCKGPGKVVATSWTRQALERKSYRVAGRTFVPTLSLSVRGGGNPFRRREFQGPQPFPHCLAVRSR